MKIIFFLSLLFAAGCSTVSKEDCQRLNWSSTGYSWALDGGTTHYVQGRTEYYCQENYGVNFDPQAFGVGYDAGIKKFCTPEAALVFGQRGGQYNGTCKGKVEKEFLEKYQLGLSQFTAGKISSMESKINSLEDENSEKNRRIRDLEDQLRNTNRKY
jgi:hypothetical protein